jgi:hypothetical protein
LITLLRGNRPEKYREKSSIELDISDRLAERLDAARKRVATEAASPIDITPNAGGPEQEGG